MTYETKDMSGALFRVREKTNPKGPDMTGKLLIGGVEYRLAGWTHEAASGGKYLSLKVQEATDKPSPPKQRAAAEIDDSIPF